MPRRIAGPGALDERVTVQSLIPTEEDGGTLSHAWEDGRTVPARVLPLSGREYEVAGIVQDGEAYEVTVRTEHARGVTTKHRYRYTDVLGRTLLLDIVRIAPLPGRAYVALTCVVIPNALPEFPPAP